MECNVIHFDASTLHVHTFYTYKHLHAKGYVILIHACTEKRRRNIDSVCLICSTKQMSTNSTTNTKIIIKLVVSSVSDISNQ